MREIKVMSKILTVEEENKLRKPIDDYVGKIQEKIDALRVDGTDKVISLQSLIESIKRDKTLSTDERNKEISELQTELKKAESVENANKNQTGVRLHHLPTGLIVNI